MGFCSDINCSDPTISRDYVKYWRMDLRHRVGWTGSWGIYSWRRAEHFNSTFWNGNLAWAFNYIDWAAYTFSGGDRIDWIGNIGAENCRPDPCHRAGNALDIGSIKFQNGRYIDMNNAGWSSKPLADRRLYLAIAAGLRIEHQNVLTWAFNALHHDHIHVDWNGVQSHVILRSTAKTDVTLIQMACNWLNGESLVIDGVWGSSTSAAYNRLRTALNVQCEDAMGNQWASRRLLRFICMHGLTNNAAGHWVGLC